jgi:hypothetical protein
MFTYILLLIYGTCIHTSPKQDCVCEEGGQACGHQAELLSVQLARSGGLETVKSSPASVATHVLQFSLQSIWDNTPEQQTGTQDKFGRSHPGQAVDR